MKKELLKVVTIFLLMIFISGCGEIPENLREEERNYEQMLEEGFKDIEYNIINDRKVKQNFQYEFKENETDVHIIDAELKDNPDFKFRICTGFSFDKHYETHYSYVSNYYDVFLHNLLVSNFQNSKYITVNDETYSRQYYSEECTIEFFKDKLIFDENSSVEEIAQELAPYTGKNQTVDFQYGNVNSCMYIYDKSMQEKHDYVDAINDAIEDYNDDGVANNFCH